ncbi:DUF2157 domain-containing protein [Edwardsiella tarda]|uniref:DUF2157 domain-containing protein n=1 Tax=Edwardsiella tarda TaxID=636 RepID=UPI003D2F0B97
MNITRKQERIIQQALVHWQQQGQITDSEYMKLVATLNIVAFDWQRLSRYAFWTAIACVLIALANFFFADRELMNHMIAIFSSSWLIRIGAPLTLAIISYLWGGRRQRREIQWHYSTEAILFLGVTCTALMLWQLGEWLDNGSRHGAPQFLIGCGCVIYGAVAWFGRSGLVWLFFLLALGYWFGAETGYVSGWGAYWLGMNYPIRFVLFGSALLLTCFLLREELVKRRLFTISKAMGLMYLFIALWIMSIFGNYDLDNSGNVTREALIPWAFLFAVVAGTCIYISLKTDDGMLRGFGLTFLTINLYTRFFEYFWDSLHNVVFFLILAVSLAVVGRYAEKIWHAGVVSENGK